MRYVKLCKTFSLKKEAFITVAFKIKFESINLLKSRTDKISQDSFLIVFYKVATITYYRLFRYKL